jgi:hypothetical protein
VPEAIVNVENVTPVTMEEVASRLTAALVKVVLNKGAPGLTARRSERCVSSGRPLVGGWSPGCLMGPIVPA